MGQIRFRRTEWDETAEEPIPPEMEELLARIDQLEERAAADRKPATTKH